MEKSKELSAVVEQDCREGQGSERMGDIRHLVEELKEAMEELRQHAG